MPTRAFYKAQDFSLSYFVFSKDINENLEISEVIGI